ncbi:MAG: hypothetical protein NZ700_05295 [Gemmataceae bacterium]|nr:hypothetical protein [Gemmataceae bacterium]MDW8263877.1 hypothetical protein [Gemmataceae bacterium]
MPPEISRAEAELVEALSVHRPALHRWLTRAFPRLGDEADHLLQDAVAETLRRVRREGFRPPVDWVSHLRQVAKHRAIDRLRSPGNPRSS